VAAMPRPGRVPGAESHGPDRRFDNIVGARPSVTGPVDVTRKVRRKAGHVDRRPSTCRRVKEAFRMGCCGSEGVRISTVPGQCQRRRHIALGQSAGATGA